jgi:hypothetical protein
MNAANDRKAHPTQTVLNCAHQHHHGTLRGTSLLQG